MQEIDEGIKFDKDETYNLNDQIKKIIIKIRKVNNLQGVNNQLINNEFLFKRLNNYIDAFN
jgi:hypothetical protein